MVYNRMQEAHAKMKIGIIGSGVVGTTLATGFSQADHTVRLGTGSRDKIPELSQASNDKYQVAEFAQVADWAEVIILCVKGSVAEKVVRSLTPQIANKPIIDTTNPITDAPPVDGVLEYFTDQNESLMERLQAIAPEAKFVKAFNSVGAGVMVHPKFATTPTMYVCGDTDGKQIVSPLVSSLGWEVEDLGAMAAARPIEDLCKLWCISGFQGNDWMHAIKHIRATH
ncbi:MAG: NAD(P)-binding domain-containing protein [Candidatus Saccharibacteria bacterium]